MEGVVEGKGWVIVIRYFESGGRTWPWLGYITVDDADPLCYTYYRHPHDTSPSTHSFGDQASLSQRLRDHHWVEVGAPDMPPELAVREGL